MTAQTRYNLRPRKAKRSLSPSSSSGHSSGSDSSRESTSTDASSIPSDFGERCMDTGSVDALLKGSRLHARCIITHENQPSSSVGPVHILSIGRARRLNELGAEFPLQRLSFMWGLDVTHGELWQPDTLINTTHMNTRWSQSFDAGEWLLLPQIDLLDQIFAEITRYAFSWDYRNQIRSWPLYTSALTPGVRKFHFVPVNPERCMPDPDYRIARRRLDEYPTLDANSDPRYEVFRSPFEGMLVESHIHPYMAIVDAMTKISWDGGRVPKIYEECLRTARNIWDMWTGLTLPCELPPAPPLRPCHPDVAPVSAPYNGPSNATALSQRSPPLTTSKSSVSLKRKACSEDPLPHRGARSAARHSFSDVGQYDIGDDDDTPSARRPPCSRMPYLDLDASPSNSVWNLPIVPTTFMNRPAPEYDVQSPTISDRVRSIAAWAAQIPRPRKRARCTSPPPPPRRKSFDEPARAAPAGDWTDWTPEWPAWSTKHERIGRASAAEGVVRPSRGRGARRQPLGDT